MAGLLTILYLLYQFWDMLFKQREDELDRVHSRVSRSRSRSNSRTRGCHKYDSKGSWRTRKPHRRCPDCALCNPEE